MTTPPALQHLNELPEDLRGPLTRFWVRVHEIMGSNARGWVVYGAAAAGTFDPLVHQVQSVLVLNQIDLEQLRELGNEGTRFGRLGIAAPLVMTPQYIDQSRDTFPLELLEIQQRHVTLAGPEYFDRLELAESHVRLQCEREWKVLLITMRQGLLASLAKKRLLSQLEQNLADTIVRTLRGMLWLKGQRQALPAAQVILQVENIMNRKLPGIRAAIDVQPSHQWETFKTLYHDVTMLSETVNGW